MTGADERTQIAESAGRIGERLATLEEKTKQNETDITKLQTDVEGLKRFQAWLFGIGTALGATAVFLANGIKDWFRT